jgi:hypothetical protein
MIGTVEVPLSNGLSALVDDRDFALVSQFKWHANTNNEGLKTLMYAIRNVKGDKGNWTGMLMHRQIMGADDPRHIDHINGNGLDNRRSNLRFVECWQNAANMSKTSRPCTSAFKGVTREAKAKKWLARIRVRGTLIRIGTFNNELSAALAYDAAAVAHFGQYAKPNFPLCWNGVSDCAERRAA